MQSVKYRPDAHGVFGSSNTPTAPSRPSRSSKPPKLAPKVSAHNATHRNGHLQKEHAEQEMRMKHSGQRADAKNIINMDYHYDKSGNVLPSIFTSTPL